MMKTLLLTLISVSLVNNVVLSQFLGLCPFLGVSKKIETAAGMGGAVIFVITIASAVTSLLYRLLVKFHVEYLETIAFILIIAALVQLVELFLKKYSVGRQFLPFGSPDFFFDSLTLGACDDDSESLESSLDSLFPHAAIDAIIASTANNANNLLTRTIITLHSLN